MTKDEALKLALETLEQIQEGCNNIIADKRNAETVDLAKLVRKDCNKPIDAIREALAQPEQEPVAWRSWNDKDKFGFWDTKAEAESWCDLDFDSEPLYTTPPPQRTWVGLTDEEMEEAMDYWSDPSRSAYGGAWSADSECVDMVRTWRYIEAKLKEKNGC